MEGPFQVASLEYAGRHDGEVSFDLGLESAGALPDPYAGETGQRPYPWRGRIIAPVIFGGLGLAALGAKVDAKKGK